MAYPYNYDTSGRQMAAKKPGGELDFRDTSESLTEGQVRIEASRCLDSTESRESRCQGGEEYNPKSNEIIGTCGKE